MIRAIGQINLSHPVFAVTGGGGSEHVLEQVEPIDGAVAPTSSDK